jgi:hypothetical protein
VIWRRLALPRLRRRLKGKKGVNRHASPYRLKNYVLYMFEKMSGLKINFDKSEVILIGGDNALASQFADLFNCQVGLFPMQYLGVPIAPGRLHVIDWARLEDKYAKKMDVW